MIWGMEDLVAAQYQWCVPLLTNLVISFLLSKTRCVWNCCQHLPDFAVITIKPYATSHVLQLMLEDALTTEM